jgi:hypothetical protein
VARNNIAKKIDIWCNYFVSNPFTELYRKGDYKHYKEIIELFNSFLADGETHAKIDSEKDFNDRVVMLRLLMKSEYLVCNEDK